MKIQCLLPKYNNGNYFAKAIECLATQSLPYSSILISENHSSDGSENMVADISKKFNNIQYFTPANMAPTFGHNVAELLAKIDESADFVHIASADDLWHSRFLEKMVKFIEKCPNDINAVFCDKYYKIDDRQAINASGNIKTKTILPSINYEAFRYFSQGTVYSIPGALFRAEVLKEMRDLIIQTENACDWFVMLEAARKGSIGYLAEPLVTYRLHSDNQHKLGIDYETYLGRYCTFLSNTDNVAFKIMQPKLAYVIEENKYKSQNPSIVLNSKKQKIKKKITGWLKYFMHKTGILRTIRDAKFKLS